ncbi:MAG: hypothetical protein JW818_14295 [Pirellulales bacterium]|nr:hypothetical protein [Pirellulales bacterium]
MKYAVLVLLLMCPSAWAEEILPELPDFLEKVSEICGDRWEVSVRSTDNMILLNSKKEALGQAAGYSFGPGEDNYTLHVRFKIVEPVTTSQAAGLRRQLAELREKAKAIKHTAAKGYIWYKPRRRDEWALVLKIQKTEQKVNDIPEYRYKSVYLSEDYSMSFFIPNKLSKISLQYKSDIERLYRLFEKTTPER